MYSDDPELEYELRARAAIITAELDLLIDIANRSVCNRERYQQRIQSLEGEIYDLMGTLRRAAPAGVPIARQ
jgi:hypothetical protein